MKTENTFYKFTDKDGNTYTAKADNRWEAMLKIEITFGIDLTGASWERDYGLNKRAAGTL